VLDTTIANVALRYMAGGLSAPATDSEWVITSYLAANAIILPMSRWLALRLGRRNYFLLSIAVFTIASALCGMSTSLAMLIGARVVQGLAGGGLQPSSQAVLLDAFPKEKQGAAQTVFGVAALLAPVVGPTLGGYITDNYGWRWIFYINIPTGLLAVWMCSKLVHDPDYLRAEQLAMRKKKSAVRHAWPLPAEPHDDLLGNRAEQRPGVGLDRRPILPCADPDGVVRARSLRTGLARAAHQESAHQFPHPGAGQPGFRQQTGDPAAAKQMTLQALENPREQQSSALAYFDTFLVFAAVGVALSFLVLLMKPSVVAKGAHVAAE